MIPIRQNAAWGLRVASRILLLCIIHGSYAIAAERPATTFAHMTTKDGFRGDREGGTVSSPRHVQDIRVLGGQARATDLRFAHLTTSDGLSQSNVTEILQDRRGFMWFATRDGLNRYDGNTFVVYKHNPNDPGSLSANYIWDLAEDDQGYLWIATNTGGVNKFDPRTERFTRYRHDPNNPNSLSGDGVASMARDSRGYLWFGTVDSGLDKFDPSTGTFTHYRNDSDGHFVERITKVIEDSHRDIWFVGGRGLFHLNPKTGEITRHPATSNSLAAEYVHEDEIGNLWMLADPPIVGLVKYDRQAERFTNYRLGTGTVGVPGRNLLADGQNGFWVPSSQGLYYFDRRTERWTYRFQHDETNPDCLNDNTVASVYRDRGGVLWVGTVEGGLNLLNLQQKQFGFYHHLPNNPNSLSPGRVTAIYEEPSGILWVGFFPRVLDRLDRKTGKITHYLPDPRNKNALGKGIDLESIYQDARGYLWLGGWGGGLDRFDKHTGQFEHYVHKADDPNSLVSDGVYSIYGDRSGQIWVGEQYGLSRLDPATEQFTHYSPDPKNPNANGNRALAIYQDRSGTLWVGRGDGALSRFDDKSKTFVNYAPDSRDPQRLQGGSIIAIHEDRAGTLWLGAWDGLYRYNRQNGTFSRYTESHGLPSSSIMGIVEDKAGRLWLSTKKGISRFDPQTKAFKNYDVSDGLQGNEFSESCSFQGPDGEMFFGGTNGFNAFFPEAIQNNPYVPPVVITSFKIFNKPVPIGAKSVLAKAVSYIDELTLSYRDNVFSFEFAALSYANSRKNRYRYKLENLEPDWNEVGSNQRLATYTNLDPGKYVFRVQGSNSDGVWNEEGVSLPIVITPPWWRTNWFRALCAAVFLVLLWAAYQFRMRQLHREFKRLRDVIETIPAHVWSCRPDGSVDFINRRWLEFSGLALEQGLGWGWQAAVHPEDLDRFAEPWRAAIASGTAIEVEARVRRADGQYRWLLIRNVPLHDATGKIVKWYCTSTDIDDRKRMEQALLRSDAYLAETQRLSHTGAWAADPTTAPLYWSEEEYRLFGLDPQLGLPVRDQPLQRIHPEDRDKFQQAFQRVIEDKADADLEFRIVLPDATVKHVYSLAHPVLNADGELVELVGSTVDITERKRAEEERERLRQLEADLAHINRVSLLGELTASIAHEVNQPLSGVVSNGSACLRWLAADPPNLEEAREATRRTIAGGKRAGEVIARIRTLTRKAATPREELDLNETIREVLALVGDEAKRKSVIIRTQFAGDVFPVLGDRVQLQQVVLNLVMNAIEAMSSVSDRTRELVVTTRTSDSDQVLVTVEDSGVGIDPEKIDKIFDSFYTTKSGGMGMGLSISRSIIQAHGGRIWATANDGPGTIFHFTLPAYHKAEPNDAVAGV